jgi:hypothetical protein
VGECTRQPRFSFKLGGKAGAGFFDCGDGEFSGYGWILVQEIVQGIAAFQIVGQDLERNAGSAETGSPPRMFRSLMIALDIFDLSHQSRGYQWRARSGEWLEPFR